MIHRGQLYSIYQNFKCTYSSVATVATVLVTSYDSPLTKTLNIKRNA